MTAPPSQNASFINDLYWPHASYTNISTIPRSVKQHLMPPWQVLLSLDTIEAPNNTLFSRTHNTPFFPANSFHSLRRRDAAETITPDDATVNFAWHRFHPPGYYKVDPVNLHPDFPATCFPRFKADASVYTHYEDFDSHERIASTQQDILSFASCTETPKRDNIGGPCCAKEFKDPSHALKRTRQDYPTGCYENFSSDFSLHQLNLQEPAADGSGLTHYFSFRPTRMKYEDDIDSYTFHHQGKDANSHRFPICFDLEIGITKVFGATERCIDKHKLINLQKRHIPFSSASQRHKKALHSRLGPPLPNYSELAHLARWFYHLRRNLSHTVTSLLLQPQSYPVYSQGIILLL